MADTKVDIATEAMTFFTASNGWQVAIHEGDRGPYLLGGSPDGVLARTAFVEDAQTHSWLIAQGEFYRYLMDTQGTTKEA